MKIISYNVNGLRAALKKGFCDWLQTHPADVICLQEAKAQPGDVDCKLFTSMGYYDYWFCANKKGYSGVTVLSKIEPDNVQCGTGHHDSDFEGRVIQLDFGKVRLLNAYFPSGTSGAERQSFKMQWLAAFYQYLQGLQQTHPNLILCGDFNIAHNEIDLHDPKSNKKSSGFLPEERAWMDALYNGNWIDTFRYFNKAPHQYTWWTQRFPSIRAQNKGWRLDYIGVTQSLQPYLKSAAIYPDVKHSDHCPVFADIAIEALNNSA